MRTQEEFNEYLEAVVILGKKGFSLDKCDPAIVLNSESVIEGTVELLLGRQRLQFKREKKNG